MHRFIFTDSCNTLWTQFNGGAQRYARLLVLTVAKSVHAICLIFYKLFLLDDFQNAVCQLYCCAAWFVPFGLGVERLPCVISWFS
jgi:hypothetical protein